MIRFVKPVATVISGVKHKAPIIHHIAHKGMICVHGVYFFSLLRGVEYINTYCELAVCFVMFIEAASDELAGKFDADDT